MTAEIVDNNLSINLLKAIASNPNGIKLRDAVWEMNKGEKFYMGQDIYSRMKALKELWLIETPEERVYKITPLGKLVLEKLDD